MTAGRLSGAAALVKVLEAHGVEHVFGLCGHTNIAILAELEKSPIRFVGVHHEQMASHAADGLARRTGRPAVVLTHVGPGLTNAITGIANAALDAIPMVVVSGNIQSYFHGRHAHMETLLRADADQASALEPWCKRIWRVDRPEALVPAARAAFRTAMTGRRGPVLIDVAMDVLSDPVPETTIAPPAPLPEPPGLHAEMAERIAEMLRAAERPVIYAGGGVNQSGGSEALARVAEALGAPVAYSMMGKGAISDRHPLVVGMPGFWGRPEANAACREADVLLAVGTSFSELDTSSWRPGVSFSIPPTRLIHIHHDASEIGRSYPPALSAVADSRLALEAIAAAVGSGKRRRVELPAHLRRLRDAFEEQLSEARSSEQVPMRPERVLADLRTALPEDGVLVGDTGWNKNGVGQQFPLYCPRTLLVPGGYATMGFGPAAVLGAVLAGAPNQVVALVGDGAFLTNLSVVATAVEEKLPVVWGVMNNGTYATISGLSRRHFASEYGTTFDASRLDYAGIARAVGADGVRVERASDLVGIFRDAFAAKRPFVIDIPCTQDAVPTTGIWEINEIFPRARA